MARSQQLLSVVAAHCSSCTKRPSALCCEQSAPLPTPRDVPTQPCEISPLVFAAEMRPARLRTSPAVRTNGELTVTVLLMGSAFSGCASTCCCIASWGGGGSCALRAKPCHSPAPCQPWSTVLWMPVVGNMQVDGKELGGPSSSQHICNPLPETTRTPLPL